MILTSGLLNDLFDDSFAIRRMNEIIKQKEITHDDDGATIKLKVPGFNKKSIDISVDSEHLPLKVKQMVILLLKDI